MTERAKCWVVAAVLLAALTAPVYAQITESITGFERDREDNLLPYQPGAYDDLKVVMFQDPKEADVTAAYIVADADANTIGPAPDLLPSSEESFVANFVGSSFFGANGSDQFMDIRYEWASTSGMRWVLVETFQSPQLGDPSLHLEGVVRMWINFPYYTTEFPDLEYTDRIGVALLIRETGNDIPQGFRDGGDGPLEFVGVSTVGFADTENPVPVPTLFFDGPPLGTGWVQVTFDLDALELAGEVHGWEFEGGDGILDAGTNGDGVNRGVLAGLVLTVDETDTTSQYVEFLVDDIEFDSPDQDPTYPPSIGAPVVQGQTSVRVQDVLSSATDVQLEIDRYNEPEDPEFVADNTLNQNPSGDLYFDFGVLSLNVGDQIRARQTNPSGTSEYSQILTVNPAAAFSFSISLDEDGNFGGAPADFEFVGAASAPAGAPQGKPVFAQTGAWQNVEFSLQPGVEPVLDFAGGNSQLEPDGGLYNIDAIWFSIDPTVPNPGPYDIFIDHIYYVDANDNEILISDAELGLPFPNFRGQSTSCAPGNPGCNPGAPDFDPLGLSDISPIASYDGTSSDRIQWEWSDSSSANTVAPYRPSVAFDDSAKAVGFWIYVPEASTNSVPPPNVMAPIVGDADGVTVEITTTGVTAVELFLNGMSYGVINTTGVTSVSFDTSATQLFLGDQFSATQTTAEGTSDLSPPRGVTVPPRVSIVSPVLASEGEVTVTDILQLEFATASKVTVYDDSGTIGVALTPGASVTVPVGNSLDVGEDIWATQTVNGLESPISATITVLEAACIEVFSDDMDSGAAWTVNTTADTAHQFGFDYSTLGIPPSPHGGGTTTGLQMKANLNSGTISYVVAMPTGLSLSGVYEVRFDFWINANGPFPGGGGGSTEFLGGGVGYDGVTAAPNGALLLITGEGGSGSDWRLYKDTTLQSTASGQYSIDSNNNFGADLSAYFPPQSPPDAQSNAFPQQTGSTNAGCGGFAWHEMVITANSDAGKVNFQVDGLNIGTINANIGAPVATTGFVQCMYGDIFTSVSDNSTLSFGVIDNFRVYVKHPDVVTPGDWNDNGGFDNGDTAALVDCLAGPSATPTPAKGGCENACLDLFDFDVDGDLDLADFQEYQKIYAP